MLNVTHAYYNNGNADDTEYADLRGLVLTYNYTLLKIHFLK